MRSLAQRRKRAKMRSQRDAGTGRMMSHRSYVPAGLLCALVLGLLVNAGPRRSWAAGESDFLSGKSKSCPGCSLPRAALKRRDLSDADLSGADLSGAVLHRARLTRAKLTGADLKDANLNKTDLKNASLPHANLQDAMVHEAESTLTDI